MAAPPPPSSPARRGRGEDVMRWPRRHQPPGSGIIPPARRRASYRRPRGPCMDPRRPHHRPRQASPAAASGDGEEGGGGGREGGGGGVRVPPRVALEGTTRAAERALASFLFLALMLLIIVPEKLLHSDLLCLRDFFRLQLSSFCLPCRLTKESFSTTNGLRFCSRVKVCCGVSCLFFSSTFCSLIYLVP